MRSAGEAFEVRWLGNRVRYNDALNVQRALLAGRSDTLLLLEHSPTYTLGVRASMANVLHVPDQVDPIEVVTADRGGDVTYHGPGQLTGYPILTVPGRNGKITAGGMGDTVAYVTSIEQMLIDVCVDLGLSNVGRIPRCTGVWVDSSGSNPRKIAAIGVKLTRERSMHGFALNVDRACLDGFVNIIPCGITDKGVTSLAAEGINVTMKMVVDAVVVRAHALWGRGRQLERADAVWRESVEDLSPFSRGQGPGSRAVNRLEQAGVDTGTSVSISQRKPEWLRVKANMGREFSELQHTIRDLGLVTVCEEAGCPNIHECWNSGTATFMVLGERCTRACGFCLVDTRLPMAPDSAEPANVAEAVRRMKLAHAVITMVARDDLADGGASHVAATIRAIHELNPGTAVEALISDHKGDEVSLSIVNDAEPDVLNHNIETVLRLQRAVRPSASYARSLSVLALAKRAGRTTKSGMMVGLGETEAEVHQTLRDLANVGVDIVTIGQYLRPTSNHLPVARWWTPAEFDALREYGMALGLAHVEASPLTRSSYHAKEGAVAASTAGSGDQSGLTLRQTVALGATRRSNATSDVTPGDQKAEEHANVVSFQ
jgi:lipoyl synthase